MIGSGVGVIVVFVLVGLLTGLPGPLIPLGVLLGLGTAMVLFGRYAQSAQYSAIAGQPGAAAAVVQSMRGNWTVTPAVAGNRNMDIVHRVVGRPGVVLIGEGAPNGLAQPDLGREEEDLQDRLRRADHRPAGRRGQWPGPDQAAAAQADAAATRAQAAALSPT